MLAVADLAKKWRVLGITLGIRAADLDFIQSTKPHSFNHCLRDMLSLWLRQQYDVCTKFVYMPCFYTESVEYGSKFWWTVTVIFACRCIKPKWKLVPRDQLLFFFSEIWLTAGNLICVHEQWSRPNVYNLLNWPIYEFLQHIVLPFLLGSVYLFDPHPSLFSTILCPFVILTTPLKLSTFFSLCM